MYANLTSWKHTVTYLHMGNSRSLILTSLLCPLLNRSIQESTAHPDGETLMVVVVRL